MAIVEPIYIVHSTAAMIKFAKYNT